MFEPQDYYFFEAKKQGYIARSAFKLEEIDNKFKLLGTKTVNVLDIGCAPGSRLQYAHRKLTKLDKQKFKIIGFDLKKSNLNLNGVYTYKQDIEDEQVVKDILSAQQIENVDLIMSDMAPDTIGNTTADAIRSVGLLRSCLWIYKKYIGPDSKFVIKIFMGPGFEEFYHELKDLFGGSKVVKIFKPKASRKESKETYIVKI